MELKEYKMELLKTPEERINRESAINSESLLDHIDEFRDRAETLQKLIDDRRKQVADLEESVREKEEISIALEKKLKERKAISDELIYDIRDEFSNLNGKLDERLSSMEDHISEVFKDVKSSEKPAETVVEMPNFDELKEDISEKIHSENVRMYRNLQDFIKEQGSLEEVEISLGQRVVGVGKRALFGIIFGVVDTVLLIFILLKIFELI